MANGAPDPAFGGHPEQVDARDVDDRFERQSPCAEAVGLSEESLQQEFPEFAAHCGSGGHSVEGLLVGIPKIQNGWMRAGITKALAKFREERG
jgi:hypothetical protein